MKCPHCHSLLSELEGYFAFTQEMDPDRIGTIWRCTANKSAPCYLTLFHQPVGTEDLLEGLPGEQG